MKNYIGQTFSLAALILVFLTGLSLIPEGIPFAGFSLRKMDIFADIRPDMPTKADMQATDSLAFFADSSALSEISDSSGLDSLGLIPKVDSALFGRVIEDYTPGQQGLKSFFEAVEGIRSRRRTVRVAFFGDSFVEGDILLGDLRDTLQTVWGGDGVGYVPITSEVARFKRTLVHRYEKWNTYSIVKNHDSHQPFGINGFVYRPAPAAFVHYEGADYFRHTGRWGEIRLFYRSERNVPFVWQSDSPNPQTDTLQAGSGQLQMWRKYQPQNPMRAVAFRIDNPDSTLVMYGASLENGPGFYLDNFSVRGNTGGRLKLIAPDLARQFDAFQQYELIVVQLGLNAVTPSLNNIRWYQAELDQTFAHIRRCFPAKPILIISVADRGGKVDGELTTLPSVIAITSMQRELARQHGFLFYDLFRGMGGAGTMVHFANQRPALANKDYTHLTHEGGKVIGQLFARLFLDAQSRYRQTANTPSSK
ncbi:MAG: hypothetical protein L6Q97_15140 [Thermoanaerobaculia bacterium]|nr:hypothetical protein [Thermoanaerobaculia bacterium]